MYVCVTLVCMRVFGCVFLRMYLWCGGGSVCVCGVYVYVVVMCVCLCAAASFGVEYSWCAEY